MAMLATLRLLLGLEWLRAPRSLTSTAIELGYAGTSASSAMSHQPATCAPSQSRIRLAAA